MSIRTRLALALLVGPLVAAADMMILYVLVGRTRSTGDTLPLHVTSFLAMTVMLVAIGYAIRQKRRLDRHDEADHFLALLAIVLGTFFALLIAAFEIPSVGLHPTD